MLAVLRIMIGLVLLISGLEKTISPYQNFLYVIQTYAMLPSFWENIVAILLPWLELIVGLMLVLGLWISINLKGALVIFAIFIVVVGQALLRGLPIDQCGCFGELVHLAPTTVIIFDSMTILVIYVLIRNISQTSRFSLDRLFRQ